MKGKEALLFLQKKKQKNSYLLGDVACAVQNPARAKVFCFFFSKKKRLLSVAQRLGGDEQVPPWSLFWKATDTGGWVTASWRSPRRDRKGVDGRIKSTGVRFNLVDYAHGVDSTCVQTLARLLDTRLEQHRAAQE